MIGVRWSHVYLRALGCLVPGELQRATTMARLYDPDGAVAAGFLDETVAQVEVGARALEVASQLAELDPDAFSETKRRLRQPTVDRIQAA